MLYGITTWSPVIHNNENNKKYKLLKMAIRIINKMAYRSHTDHPLFKSCKILNKYQSILFVYDYETNKTPYVIQKYV